ncbi:two-component system QseEF-associated lipoprotein QseG [Brenneria corticis]|uniref:Two-component system QseEF-associated lipoprotein QseG n=2 Tax=Brenneria corticis TaxID=2173106 RepID=A0A2U1UBH9_9GAMM|nr:two-component system QseEF-associated lipoprotein QseG [Brenneria sp. CFCC 11842]PWC19018.1 two-component system QseEF-associated lipoprotein QseG [Brenneria sp. CFCC 11842]
MSVSRVLKAVVMSLPVAALAGCISNVSSYVSSQDTENSTPKEQVTDYRMAQCGYLWRVDGREAMNNALYWLRAMDCAGRLPQYQAREEAQRLEADSWENAFKRGILLDNAGITQAERGQMLEQINVYRLAFPAALRPLIQTWRDRQTLFLALSDERLRYKRLQESSDKQLDTLRIQQNHLQYQLETTRKKLENLTDIERQLSSRKQLSGELPESDADRRNPAAERDGARGEAATKSGSGAVKADDTYAPPAESEADQSTTEEPKSQ